MAIKIDNNTPNQRKAVENVLNEIYQVYTPIGQQANLYPFKIVSGITNFTENGEFNLSYNVNKSTSIMGVINSNEPITCYWEGSYQSIKENENDLFQKKIFKEGRVISTWVIDYNISTFNDSFMWNENNYTNIMLNRTIRSFSVDWVPTDDEQRYYVFIYLDKKGNSPQFLRLINKTPHYKPNGELLGCSLEFVNLNTSFSESGRDILSFLKLKEPGGNCAFPKETINDDNSITLSLDEDYLNNVGCSDIQLEFTGSFALNSIVLYGRPASRDIIYAPRHLLLIHPKPTIPSSLQILGAAVNNYYALFNTKTIFNGIWNDWATKLSTYYNYTAKKTFIGGLSLGENGYDSAFATNPVSGTGQYNYNLWDIAWRFNSPSSSYDCREAGEVVDTFTYESTQQLSVVDFLNNNAFIYGAVDTLPIEYQETTRWSIGDVPIVGKILSGFLTFFTGGFSPGWTDVNTWVPSKPVNLLCPTTTLNIAKTISEGTSLNPIFFDLFNNSIDLSAAGNKMVVCGYHFAITNYFKSTNPDYIISGAPAGKGGGGVWDTLYLGQIEDEEGNQLLTNGGALLWDNTCSATDPINANERFYAVDKISYAGIGLCDVRMTFYNQLIPNYNSTAISNWEVRQQTNAKFKGDPTLWRNTLKLNFSESFNNIGLVTYPKYIPLPSPENVPIHLINLEGNYFNLPNISENKTTPGMEPSIKRVIHSVSFQTVQGYNIEWCQDQKPQELRDNWFTAIQWVIYPEAYDDMQLINLVINNNKSKQIDLSEYLGNTTINNYENIKIKLGCVGESSIYYKDFILPLTSLGQWITLMSIDDIVANEPQFYPNDTVIISAQASINYFKFDGSDTNNKLIGSTLPYTSKAPNYQPQMPEDIKVKLTLNGTILTMEFNSYNRLYMVPQGAFWEDYWLSSLPQEWSNVYGYEIKECYLIPKTNNI